MGLRYRKSINLGGGFRVNISKSGVGYSWGCKGYRVTKTAKGTIRKTVSIPGTGLSYVEETSNKKNIQPIQKNIPIDNNAYDTKEFVNRVSTNMVSNGLEDVIKIVRKTMRVNTISTLGICISLIISVINPVFILFLVASIALKIYVKTAGLVKLDYEIESDQQEKINNLMKPMLEIANSKKVWRITQSSKVIDKKYTSGASNIINRVACSALKKAPYPLKTNIPVASFITKSEKLIFLPDKLLIIQKNKIGALNYSDIQINIYEKKFVEDHIVPKDTKIVGKTWKYVNKNGSPDKRFKNNRQLPICEYGEIKLTSSYGLNTVIMFSKSFRNIYVKEFLQMVEKINENKKETD